LPDFSAMSEEHERESGRRGGFFWLMVVAAGTLLYVLSLGPAGAIANHNPSSYDLLRVAYYPVIWLHDYTPLEKPLEAYGRLWGWH
jgi:hypothetical protein